MPSHARYGAFDFLKKYIYSGRGTILQVSNYKLLTNLMDHYFHRLLLRMQWLDLLSSLDLQHFPMNFADLSLSSTWTCLPSTTSLGSITLDFGIWSGDRKSEASHIWRIKYDWMTWQNMIGWSHTETRNLRRLLSVPTAWTQLSFSMQVNIWDSKDREEECGNTFAVHMHQNMDKFNEKLHLSKKREK